VLVSGSSALAAELRQAAAAAGWEVLSENDHSQREAPPLMIDVAIGHDQRQRRSDGGPRAICCASGSLAALDAGGRAVGFHALPPLAEATVVELTRGAESPQSTASAVERFFQTLGKHTVWVADAPGLVLGRIVCQVINEAAFALGEGVGSARDIDAGMMHGLNYPRGILAWADEVGLDHVLAVLDALHRELGEERYRAAPALTRRVWSGRLGRQTGEGFFTYGGERDENVSTMEPTSSSSAREASRR